MHSYIVIGGRKCGSTSMEEYLKSFGHDVIRVEQLFTKTNGPDIYLKQFSNRIPVVIIRNGVDRAWSDYWYSVNDKGLHSTYEEYLDNPPSYDYRTGDLNPISQSNYRKWFKIWKNVDLQVRWLEDMWDLPKFPHLTKGNVPIMTPDQRSLTLDKIIDDTTGAC